MRRPGKKAVPALLAATLAAGGCSIRSMATRSLADALSGSGSSWASDDDPELVRDAVPFALKTMEQVLGERPRHLGLLLALASGFTQYGYAFVQQEADVLAERDIARAREIEARARRLYLRGRDYGLRGLEVRRSGARAALAGPRPEAWRKVLAAAEKRDVPLLYWTAAAWALAISAGKDQPQLIADLPVVEAMMARALVLDETFDRGSLHEFYVVYDGSRSEAEGGGAAKARKHLERARTLSQGRRLGPLVSFAETVTVAAQDRREFTRLLEQVVAANPDRWPTDRLANVIAQRRARWLLGRADDLFAE